MELRRTVRTLTTLKTWKIDICRQRLSGIIDCRSGASGGWDWERIRKAVLPDGLSSLQRTAFIGFRYTLLETRSKIYLRM